MGPVRGRGLVRSRALVRSRGLVRGRGLERSRGLVRGHGLDRGQDFFICRVQSLEFLDIFLNFSENPGSAFLKV